MAQREVILCELCGGKITPFYVNLQIFSIKNAPLFLLLTPLIYYYIRKKGMQGVGMAKSASVAG